MLTDAQETISALIEARRPKDKSWKKFYGDVCCRIFKEFLLREIPKNYTIRSPNAYIVGFPTEFDLLIVDGDTAPEEYTNAFSPEKVKCGIEIKAHGIFAGRKELTENITKIKENFNRVKNKYPSIEFVYLTYEEVASTKREGSIQYLDKTRQILNPYKVFCLRDSRKGEVIQGEWGKLISHLKAILI